MSRYKDALKAWVNRLGIDVCRLNNSPKLTLCGVRSRRIQTVIDVGANTGQFARYTMKFFPDATFYCFEPLPGPYLELQEWARKKEGKVHLYNMAVGDDAGTIKINVHSEHTPSSSILKSTKFMESNYPQTKAQEPITVAIDTLDNVLLNTLTSSMEGEVLLKLDVQGYEDRVLRGARKVLARTHVCIIEISLVNLYSGQAEFLDLMSQLHASGFHYAGNLSQSYAEDGCVLYLDAVFIKS